MKIDLEIEVERQDGHIPPAIWPDQNGIIEVDDLSVQYSEDLPLVLHNVTFKVLPQVRDIITIPLQYFQL